MKKINKKNIFHLTMIAFVLCAMIGNVSIQANDEVDNNEVEMPIVETEESNINDETVEAEDVVVESTEEEPQDVAPESAAVEVSALETRSLTTQQEAELWGFDLEFFKVLQNQGKIPRTQVTQADLDKVTYLSLINTPTTLTSIRGIEQFKNLTQVIMNTTNIQNEEMPRIQAISKLKSLEISYNNSLTDIASLGAMDSLESFSWSNNGGSVTNYVFTHGAPIDLNGIKGKFVNLKELTISQMPALNSDAYESFTKLERMVIFDSALSDLSFVDKLPNLNYLDIRNNRVFDISALKGRDNVTVYASGQMKVNYGPLAVDFDVAKETGFKTDATMIDSTGTFVTNVTGYTVDKGVYDNQNIVWTDMSAADLKGYTYTDIAINKKIPFTGVGYQLAATNLPTNIKSFSATIFQEILLVDKLPATLEIDGNDVYITEGDSVDLMEGVVATDYNGKDITSLVTYVVRYESEEQMPRLVNGDLVGKDTSKLAPGTYKLQYEVVGGDGTAVQKEKRLFVKEKAAVVEEEEEDKTTPSITTPKTTAPSEKVSETNQVTTGDTNNLSMLIALLGITSIGIAYGLYRMKK